ncbi:two-component system sensor histidine kinase NtrB [Bacterioplanes sanyensis]|uniref:Sensory histidine kinase/phosphatase NtrB n=1 Tax=Bacterioplanes sanyensis TaxID=1249553 RepID=A0A222FP27_9GAMM|nr:nitrogen regulation protein NR(II) [Bacterioplanes sanyensis]ASP37169.1 two-component system sensor histidine kinase NtrB [Bacterioplanes sanyensis]ASP40767.1 two-component system sensor histidine kinase NtrB [Bacterioplanes sanyensis]
MLASPVISQRLLEHLNTGVLLLDSELTVTYMNPAAEALLEMSGKRGLGVHFWELVVEADKDRDALEEAIVTGHSYTKREATIMLHNQQQVTLDYSVSPVAHPETRLPTLLIELQGRDRLMRISREEQLIAKQETTRSLVRGLAHEIKNPLGGIRGAAQLLERELPSESLREYTQIIIEEADRLRDLVDRLLGPRQIPKQEDVNVHEVLERVCQLIGVESHNRIRIRRDYDPSIPELLADKDQMIQALLNICRNAMQAMLESHTDTPTLSLRTRTVRQFTIGHNRHRLVVQIDIQDNGPGIPESLQENLFYPMVSGRADGTGLGLSIAQSIINQCNGIIEFDSQPDRTVFSIYLPLENL